METEAFRTAIRKIITKQEVQGMFDIQTAETYRICRTYILVRMSGVTKWGKVNKWEYAVMEAIGSTCNIRKLTRKGQVEEKHRSEAYGHQKLNWKGNKGQGSEYPCTRLGCVCPEVA